MSNKRGRFGPRTASLVRMGTLLTGVLLFSGQSLSQPTAQASPSSRIQRLYTCGLVFHYQDWLNFYQSVSKMAEQERFSLLKDKTRIALRIFSWRELSGQNKEETRRLKFATDKIVKNAEEIESLLGQPQVDRAQFDQTLSRLRESVLQASRLELSVSRGSPEEADSFFDVDCKDCRKSDSGELDSLRAQSLALSSIGATDTPHTNGIPKEWLSSEFSARCDRYWSTRSTDPSPKTSADGPLVAQKSSAGASAKPDEKSESLPSSAAQELAIRVIRVAKMPEPPRTTPDKGTTTRLAQVDAQRAPTKQNASGAGVINPAQAAVESSAPPSNPKPEPQKSKAPVCSQTPPSPGSSGEDQETDPCASAQLSAAEKKAQEEKEQKELLELLKDLRPGGDLPRFVESPLFSKPIDRESLEEKKKAEPSPTGPPTRPVNEAQWRKRAIDALNEYKKTKELPKDFVLADHWLENESRSKDKPEEKFHEVTELWKKSVERYRKLQTDPETRQVNPLQTLIKPLFEDYLSRRDPKSSQMTDFLRKGAGNEQAQTRLFLAAIQDSRVEIPAYLRVAVELDPKTQAPSPVLIHRETGEVTQLMTGQNVQSGAVVDSAFLVAQDLGNPKPDPKDFLLKPKPSPSAVAAQKKAEAPKAAVTPQQPSQKDRRIATPTVDTSGSFLDRLKAFGDLLGVVMAWVKELFSGKIGTGEVIEALGALLAKTPDLLKLLGQIDLKQFGLLGNDLGSLSPQQNKGLMGALAGKLTAEDVRRFAQLLKAGDFDRQIEELSQTLKNDPKFKGIDPKKLKETIASELTSNNGKNVLQSALKDDQAAKEIGNPQRMGFYLAQLQNDLPGLSEIMARPKTDEESNSQRDLLGYLNTGFHYLRLTQFNAQQSNRVKEILDSAKGKWALSALPALVQSELRKKLLSNEFADWVETAYHTTDMLLSKRAGHEDLGGKATRKGFEEFQDQEHQKFRERFVLESAALNGVLESPDLFLSPKYRTSLRLENFTSHATLRDLLQNQLDRNKMAFTAKYENTLSDQTFVYFLERDQKLLQAAFNQPVRGASAYRPTPVPEGNMGSQGTNFAAREELLLRVPEIELQWDRLEQYMNRMQAKPDAHLKLISKMDLDQLNRYLRTNESIQSLRHTFHTQVGLESAPIQERDARLPILDLLSKVDPAKVRVAIPPRGQKAREPQPPQNAQSQSPGRKAQSQWLGWLPSGARPMIRESRDASNSTVAAQESTEQKAQSAKKGKKEGVDLLQDETSNPIELTLSQWSRLHEYVEEQRAQTYRGDTTKVQAKAQAALDRLITQNFVRGAYANMSGLQSSFFAEFLNEGQSYPSILKRAEEISALRNENEDRIVFEYQGQTHALTFDIAFWILSKEWKIKGAPGLTVPKPGESFADGDLGESLKVRTDRDDLIFLLAQALETQSPYESVRHYFTGQTALDDLAQSAESRRGLSEVMARVEAAKTRRAKKSQITPPPPSVWRKVKGAEPFRSEEALK